MHPRPWRASGRLRREAFHASSVASHCAGQLARECGSLDPSGLSPGRSPPRRIDRVRVFRWGRVPCRASATGCSSRVGNRAEAQLPGRKRTSSSRYDQARLRCMLRTSCSSRPERGRTAWAPRGCHCGRLCSVRSELEKLRLGELPVREEHRPKIHRSMRACLRPSEALPRAGEPALGRFPVGVPPGALGLRRAPRGCAPSSLRVPGASAGVASSRGLCSFVSEIGVGSSRSARTRSTSALGGSLDSAPQAVRVRARRLRSPRWSSAVPVRRPPVTRGRCLGPRSARSARHVHCCMV